MGATSATDEQVGSNYFLCEGDFFNNSCKNMDDDTGNIKAAVAA